MFFPDDPHKIGFTRALHHFGQQTGRHGRCVGPRRGIFRQERQGLEQRDAVTLADDMGFSHGKTMGKALANQGGMDFGQNCCDSLFVEMKNTFIRGISMDLADVFCQVSMDFNGFQWISMDFNGFQWILE